MKNFTIIFLLLLTSSLSVAQIVVGTSKPEAKPGKDSDQSGPTIPTDEKFAKCGDDCLSNRSLRENEIELVKVLSEQQSKCLGLPVKFENIIEFYNHVMVRVLVNKLRYEATSDCHQRVGNSYLQNCLLTESLKYKLTEFIKYPVSLNRYLMEEHKLSQKEAQSIIESLKLIVRSYP
ncbi:MAG: hypothetical protein ACOYL6_05115 [Bacteriovoracaceae bacterium]